MFTPGRQYGTSFTVKTPGANLPRKQRTRFSPSYPNLRHSLARLQQMSGAAVSSLGRSWWTSISRPRAYSMFTARAARSAIVAKDMDACTIIRVLAQRESTGTSVGEKAVLVLKARNR